MKIRERLEDLWLETQSRWLILYDFFRRDIPRVIRNFWTFRKAICDYRWYSGEHGVLLFMEAAVRNMERKKGKYGYESDTTASLSRAQMRRASELMRLVIEDDFITLAEKELGLKLSEFKSIPSPDNPGLYRIITTQEDDEIFKKSTEIEGAVWDELWTIIRGTKKQEYDGTDLRSWWD
jgi:hypothetical protein